MQRKGKLFAYIRGLGPYLVQLEVRGLWHLLLWHIMKCNNDTGYLFLDRPTSMLIGSSDQCTARGQTGLPALADTD